MNYKKIILNKLLARYEKSKSYKEQTSRRILIKTIDIDEYDIENYEKKQLFHADVKYLKEKNLIDFSWQKYEIENIIESIWLNKENINLAYKEAERDNIKIQAISIKNELENVKFKNEWLENFKKDLLENIISTEKESNVLPYIYHKEIIRALQYIDLNQSWLERTFSINCFGDSKFFEKNIKKYIIKIVKKYLLTEMDVDYTDEEILLEIGISKYPEIIEFNGNISMQLDDVNLDFNIISNGSYINSDAIKKISKIDISQINKVLFIENKANYIEYISKFQKKNELVIFHGGMYSPNKKNFFEKVYKYANKNTSWYHWSDIDLGRI